ncbi:hypothetical protein [Ruegeria atlantica]|uniref:hypothetical protein n=1 Tax=Ruegeria atlantica TaxID=81569 RepID=UPI00147F18C8|nr:hypothetical protein [Ruegeria atlantica]
MTKNVDYMTCEEQRSHILKLVGKLTKEQADLAVVELERVLGPLHTQPEKEAKEGHGQHEALSNA